jgi:hypothetical protein
MCSDLLLNFIAELSLCTLRGDFLGIILALPLNWVCLNQFATGQDSNLKEEEGKGDRNSTLIFPPHISLIATHFFLSPPQERFRKTLVKTSDLHQQLSKKKKNS